MWWQSSVILAHVENLTTLWDLSISLFDSSDNVTHSYHVECRSHITFIYTASGLTVWLRSWTFTVQHTIYVKCEYFMNQEG